MGSQQETDLPLPFGYSIDPALGGLDFFGQPPLPAPPGGHELLTEDERQRLDDFFLRDILDGAPLDIPGATASLYGEGLHFSDDWYTPPEVIAHGTSFGPPGGADQFAAHHFDQQPRFYQYISPPSVMMPPPGPVQSHAGDVSTPADVLAAATALSRANGAHNAAHNAHGGAHSNLPFGVSNMPPTPATVTAPAAPLQSYPFGGYGAAERHAVPRNEEEVNFISDMLFGDRSVRPMNRRPAPPAEVVQYGSDPNFNTPSYQPQSWHGTLEAMREQQDGLMECLTRTESAAPTRASSPVPSSMPPLGEPLGPLPIHMNKQVAVPQSNQPLPDGDEPGPPRKRRKSKQKLEEELSTVRVSSKPKGGRSSKLLPVQNSSPPSDETVGPSSKKRRRSMADGSSPPKTRENLSEEQKRENHIKSEQKRRTMIKEGFEDLAKVVPGLHNGGMSKSGMLQVAGKFLGDLLEGNDRLRKQLEAVQATKSAASKGHQSSS